MCTYCITHTIHTYHRTKRWFAFHTHRRHTRWGYVVWVFFFLSLPLASCPRSRLTTASETSTKGFSFSMMTVREDPDWPAPIFVCGGGGGLLVCVSCVFWSRIEAGRFVAVQNDTLWICGAADQFHMHVYTTNWQFDAYVCVSKCHSAVMGEKKRTRLLFHGKVDFWMLRIFLWLFK